MPCCSGRCWIWLCLAAWPVHWHFRKLFLSATVAAGLGVLGVFSPTHLRRQQGFGVWKLSALRLWPAMNLKKGPWSPRYSDLTNKMAAGRSLEEDWMITWLKHPVRGIRFIRFLSAVWQTTVHCKAFGSATPELPTSRQPAIWNTAFVVS